MWDWYIWIFFSFFLPAILVWGGVWFLFRRLSFIPRIAILVISAALLITPSWAPATIVTVPVPFGFLLGIALFTGGWSELVGTLGFFAIWHAIAFPATAVVFYIIVRLLFSNKRFKPTAPPPLRSGGSAA